VLNIVFTEHLFAATFLANQHNPILVIFLHVLLEPMLLLLLGAGLIYMFLGETQDALMLLFFVFIVVGITFYQQRKTERALEQQKNGDSFRRSRRTATRNRRRARRSMATPLAGRS
jgi:magnesium-transporting ATPase (P-type)